MNPKIFREYDIRAVIGKDLQIHEAREIGRAFAAYTLERGKKRVVVGEDNRLSSAELREEIIAGLREIGCDVYSIGVIPTPVFYFTIYNYKKDAGVMITASHNPPEFNGFKLCDGTDTLYGDKIQHIYQIIQKGDFPEGKGKLFLLNPVSDYLDVITKGINLGRKLKVVIDAGNGTAGRIASEAFQRLGNEVIELYCEPNGNFPNHLPDPVVADNLKDLIQKVKETNADVGIGLDGDGDRIGVVDEKGNILWGDTLLAIFARQVLKESPRAKIIFEVKCSQALIEDIEFHEGQPIMWKTGHSLIKDKLKKENAHLAGEMSGHMYFADRYFGYDDAIYASLRLIEIISNSEKTLSEMVSELPSYCSSPEIRITCEDEVKFQIVDEVKQNFLTQGYKVIDIDGARVVFEDGWGLVRASNTQPALVLRYEAKDQEGLEKIKNKILSEIEKAKEKLSSSKNVLV
jgi:phosphomannomutase/phosphoglucomutase